MRGSVRRWILSPFLSLFAACDPCFGTSVCVEPHLDYRGEVVLGPDAVPAAGIRVGFVRTGGIRLSSDSLSASTDPQGRFRLEVEAREAGVVRGDLIFDLPSGYGITRVRDVRLGVPKVRREDRSFEWWFRNRISHAGEVWWRVSRQPAAGVQVEFIPTGGVAVVPEQFRTTTNQHGHFMLAAEAAERGKLTGDLVITPPAPYRPVRVEGIQLNTTVLAGEVQVMGNWGVGLHISYGGRLVWFRNWLPAQGVQVEFRRTGGIAVEPSTFVTQTDANGNFGIVLRPLNEQEGEVIGDLIVRPPAPHRTFTITERRLSTSDKDGEVRFLGTWAVGAPGS